MLPNRVSIEDYKFVYAPILFCLSISRYIFENFDAYGEQSSS